MLKLQPKNWIKTLLIILSIQLSTLVSFGQKTASIKTKDMPVIVNVILKKTTDKSNLILYNPERRLVIADFMGKYEAKWFGVAATNSGIGLDMSGKSENGTLKVNITITVMFDKNKSWMKEAGKNNRILGHEQNHFDLTAIKACEMIEALEKAEFDIINLNQQIKTIHDQYVKALNQIQEEYDKDTNHGTVYEQQLAWSTKISEQLKTIALCY